MLEIRNPCFMVFYKTKDKPGHLVKIFKSSDGNHTRMFSSKQRFSEYKTPEKPIKAFQLKEIKLQGEKNLEKQLKDAEIPIIDIGSENNYINFLEEILFLTEEELEERIKEI